MDDWEDDLRGPGGVIYGQWLERKECVAPKPAPASEPSKEQERPRATSTVKIDDPKVVLLKKPNQKKAHRIPVALRIVSDTMLPIADPSDLDLSAELTWTNTGKIKVYKSATDMTEQKSPMKFDAVALAKKEEILFVEGAEASDSMGDVEFELALKAKSKWEVATRDSQKNTITCVDLTLDICHNREKAGEDPKPMSENDKLDVGRLVHEQDTGNHHGRALLIVRKVKPENYDGKLMLDGVNAANLQLYKDESPGKEEILVPHEINLKTEKNEDKKFWVQGKKASAALRDVSLFLRLKEDRRTRGDTIALTIFKITKIEAKVRGTPCHRDKSRANTMPAKSSTKDSKTFDATAITMIRECGDLKLEANVIPNKVKLSWDVERAADDDKGLTGTPTHSKDGDENKRLLKTDATGSFHVSAFVDYNGNGKRDEGEDGLILNVNIVNIDVPTGRWNNRISKISNLFTAVHSNPTTLRVDSGSTGGIAPGVNASYNDLTFNKYPLAIKVTVKLTGGGADQRRGVDKVGLGYIQQTTADSVCGTYSDGRTLKEVIVENSATPSPITAGAPTMLAFPVRDTRGASSSGTGPFIISSSDRARKNDPAGGQYRIVRYVDPPAIILNLTHPVTNSSLASISGSNNFKVFLSAYSSDFNENYVVIANAAWSVTYGTYSAAAGWTNVNAKITAPSVMTVQPKITKGESTDVERCPPNFVDNLVMDAR